LDYILEWKKLDTLKKKFDQIYISDDCFYNFKTKIPDIEGLTGYILLDPWYRRRDIHENTIFFNQIVIENTEAFYDFLDLSRQLNDVIVENLIVKCELEYRHLIIDQSISGYEVHEIIATEKTKLFEELEEKTKYSGSFSEIKEVPIFIPQEKRKIFLAPCQYYFTIYGKTKKHFVVKNE
jgi:hypothetical protein